MCDCPEDDIFRKRIDECESEDERERVREEWMAFKYKAYRRIYADSLNSCIDRRYRQKGFSINYVLSNGESISSVIKIVDSDKVIHVNGTHTISRSDCEYVLDSLGQVPFIRVGGFHFGDCVQRFAEVACLRGVESLVDEELTELFGGFFERSDFNPEIFPSIDPRKKISYDNFIELFVRQRQDKPWLYQWQS